MTIRDLQPNVEYEMLRDIVDFHGQYFCSGQRLVLPRRHFFPYDDGHTVVFNQERKFMPGSFRELSMYLPGTDHEQVVEHASDYFRPIAAVAYCAKKSAFD